MNVLPLLITLLAPAQTDLVPIDLSGFHSSAHHWRDLRAPNRFITVEPNQPSYAPSRYPEIVANILLYQRENGGWPKDYDMTAVLTDAQRAAVAATRDRTDSSYDNDNIHSQVAYLAHAYTLKPVPAWRTACERGLDFILASQYPNGGFPQRYPDAEGYPAHITYNDGVMIGILNVLQDAAEPAPHFAWLDPDRRQQARDAVTRGVACILATQIEVNGTLTGWCQQHDQTTLEPRPARTFELASICPQDTTQIVRFLMRQPPTPALLAATDAAVAWMGSTQLNGVRLEKVPAPLEEFPGYTAAFDTVVIDDPAAPPLWARHYEIRTNRPIFAGRDAIKKYALADIERERRTGTAWYGSWPTKLLTRDYPAWRAKATPVP